MTKKLELKERLNFEKVDLTSPAIIIQRIGEQLLEETNGCVKGVIETYSGRIDSYVKKSSMEALAATLGNRETKVEIQKSLGKIGDEINRFEFYIHTPIYECFKYRILFLEFGTANYPVKVVLERGVAEEILADRNRGYKKVCNSPNELEELIYAVLNSEHMIKIMQELINIRQIKTEEELLMVEENFLDEEQ